MNTNNINTDNINTNNINTDNINTNNINTDNINTNNINTNNINTKAHQQDQPWDLVVVGAGIGGLNALHVATEYLPKDARVLLIDKRQQVGGMWNTTYNHVHLHQPYQSFTAGNIEWKLGKNPSHLANRFEVLEHLRHCLEVISQRCELHTMFAADYEGHEEAFDEQGSPMARVHVNVRGHQFEVSTKRFIKAIGFNAQPQEPLALSSDQVRSVTPESWEYMGESMNADSKPIYVVGGGKTGVDAAYEAAKRYPGRAIHLIAGSGVSFFNRATTFTTGIKRYTSGTSLLGTIIDLALRYDGQNEQDVYEHFVKRHGLAFEGIETNNCRFGLLSPEEKRTIDEHVQVRKGYLEDVIETDGGKLVMTFRGGEQQEIEAGSWIVNCKSTLLQEALEPEPCLSPNGAILSITPSAGLLFLTSVSGYLLTHLWMRDKLADAPLWLMDLQKLGRTEDKRNFLVAGSAQITYNVLTVMDRLDLKTMLHCLPTGENWYPTYRILWMFGKLLVKQRSVLKQLRGALETFEVRHPLRRPVVGEVPALPANSNIPATQHVNDVVTMASA
ncbi:MAG: NAD(P)-binding protein [Deinococcota bacterium]